MKKMTDLIIVGILDAAMLGFVAGQMWEARANTRRTTRLERARKQTEHDHQLADLRRELEAVKGEVRRFRV